jgi:drug/metabolite transporter (DMT)-like permease
VQILLFVEATLSTVKKETALTGYLKLFVANLFFAGGYTFVAATRGAVSVWHLLLIRGVIYLILLFPRALRHKTEFMGRNHRGLILRGALGTVYLALMAFAILHAPLSLSTILDRLQPFWTELLSWFLFGTVVGTVDLIGTAMALGGIVLICLPEGHISFAHISPLAAGAALLAGVINSFALMALRSLRRTDLPGVINFWYALALIVVSAPLAIAGGRWPTSFRVWLCMAGFGVSSFIGQMLLAKAMHESTPTAAATEGLLLPVFASILGWVFFDERLSTLESFGMALVIVSGAVVIRAQARLKKAR